MMFVYVVLLLLRFIAPTKATIFFGGNQNLSEYESTAFGQVAIYCDVHFICSGSLIRWDTVLTAAHCLFFRKNCNRLNLVTGKTKLTKFYVFQEQTRIAREVVEHPLYDRKSRNNDLALIKTEKPFNRTQYVRVLNWQHSFQEHKTGCKVVGWGFINEENQTISDTLVTTEIEVVDKAHCNEEKTGSDSVICVRSPGEKESLEHGYSLVCYPYLVGIVKREDSSVVSYTNITAYKDWIKSFTGSASHARLVKLLIFTFIFCIFF